MLDQVYRRRPCPWCGSLVKKFDYGSASVIRYPETVSASERVINQRQWWWLSVPVILTGVSAWLCFLSLPPLLAAMITVAIGIGSVFLPPWRSKIVEHVKQII
jgi:hypothetical protein